MKRFVQVLLAIAMTLNFTFSPALAVSLEPQRFYEEAGFTDVGNDWSLPYIRTCYEFGLMSGQGVHLFVPNGSVSVAEGIMVSARLHNLWQGGTGTFSNGETWYTDAVQYALEKNIFTEDQFSDYEALITRRQLAGLLAHALPPDEYFPINSITTLPDVPKDDSYAEEIFKLYNAGILTGTDSYGTFAPNANITRAELAAILCRLVRPETRQVLSSVSYNTDAGSLLILYFYASWCNPCKTLTPTIDQLAEQYQEQDVHIQKIDVDIRSDLAEQHSVTSYPTVIFLLDNRELDRQVGVMPLETYQNILSKWL